MSTLLLVSSWTMKTSIASGPGTVVFPYNSLYYLSLRTFLESIIILQSHKVWLPVPMLKLDTIS